MAAPGPKVEVTCPACKLVQVTLRPRTGRGVFCRQCQHHFYPALSAWEVPESADGQPVAPRLRELLADLSAVMHAPDRYTLAQEVAIVEALLHFLASAEGRERVNLWAFHQWCAYGGDETSYAPDPLNDIYADLDYVGLDNGALPPEELLARLAEFKRTGLDATGSAEQDAER